MAAGHMQILSIDQVQSATIGKLQDGKGIDIGVLVTGVVLFLHARNKEVGNNCHSNVFLNKTAHGDSMVGFERVTEGQIILLLVAGDGMVKFRIGRITNHRNGYKISQMDSIAEGINLLRGDIRKI